MNGYPPPSPPDASWWLGVLDHAEGIAGAIVGAIGSAGVAIWRMAVWTERMKTLIDANRLASDARHDATETASSQRHYELMQKLEDMKASNAMQHEMARREMDQLRTEVRDDRAETRALSGRMESVFAGKH